MAEMTGQATTEARREYLHQLADELTRRGFRATPASSRTGVPLIRVVNPEAPVLSETVCCTEDPDGTVSFAWPWGKRIGPAEDTQTAADAVARVLGTRPGAVTDE